MKRNIFLGGFLAFSLLATSLSITPTMADTLNTSNTAVIQLLEILGYDVTVNEDDTITINKAGDITNDDYSYYGDYLLESDVMLKYPEITSIVDDPYPYNRFDDDVIISIDGYYDTEEIDTKTNDGKRYLDENEIIEYMNEYNLYIGIDTINVEIASSVPNGYISEDALYETYPEIDKVTVIEHDEARLTIDGYPYSEDVDCVMVDDVLYLENDNDINEFINDYNKYNNASSTNTDTTTDNTYNGITVDTANSVPRGYISEKELYAAYPTIDDITVVEHDEARLTIDGYNDSEEVDCVMVDGKLYLEDDNDINEFINEYNMYNTSTGADNTYNGVTVEIASSVPRGYISEGALYEAYPEIDNITVVEYDEAKLTIDGYNDSEEVDCVMVDGVLYLEDDNDINEFINEYNMYNTSTDADSTYNGVTVEMASSVPRGYISEDAVYSTYPDIDNITVVEHDEARLTINGYNDDEDVDCVMVDGKLYLEEEDIAEFVNEYKYGYDD